MDRNQTPRLDPRRPLVLDTRELGRRPGSMRETILDVPAPEGLGLIDLIGVPVDAPLHLELRLESVMEGVLVTADATAPVVGQCGRCLEPISDTARVGFQELYVYPEGGTGTDEDADESHVIGDLIDLEPALRDAVVLALPLTPLCSPDCEGLCATCGERWAVLPDEHTHDVVDPRWSALQDLMPAHGQQATGPEEN